MSYARNKNPDPVDVFDTVVVAPAEIVWKAVQREVVLRFLSDL